MRAVGHSEAVEMYLKTLAFLGGGDGPIPAAAVAERLAVTSVATNEMLRRLGTEGLVEHQQRHGFRLTEQGRAAAWNIVRRQRLWERFLVDRLELEPGDAMRSACLLEHATAPEVLDALDAFLGFPASCPEGQPIPRSPADRVRHEGPLLADHDAGQTTRLVAFDDTDEEVLGYLHELGLTVGSVVRISAVGPRRSHFTLEGASGAAVLAREIAMTIHAEPITPDAAGADDVRPADGTREAAVGDVPEALS